MKTAERAHTPKELWESVKLDPSYNKALEQIDNELQYWPNFLKHKCKQRFTRLRQILVKRKKMKLEGRAEYKIVSHKAEKREKTRLVKAEKSAVIENHVIDGLLKNLKDKKYKGIYNANQKAFNTMLENENVISENLDEDFNEEDYEKGYIFSDEDSENEDDENEDEENENNDNINEEKSDEKDNEQKEKSDNDDEIDDIFNQGKGDKKVTSKKGKKTGKKRKRQKIEYEQEYENTHKNVNYNLNTNNNDIMDDYL